MEKKYTYIEFKEKVKDIIFNVTFTKKDGSIREMKATTNFELIPKEYHPTTSIKESEIFPIIIKDAPNTSVKVFDLDKKGWRTIILDTIIKLDNCNTMVLPSVAKIIMDNKILADLLKKKQEEFYDKLVETADPQYDKESIEKYSKHFNTLWLYLDTGNVAKLS